jgi:hypothetical protein
VRAAEDRLDVSTGDVREFFTPFKRVQVAVVSHGAEQRDGEGAGANPCFHYPGTGEDVGHGNDLPGILRVHHGSSAGHGEDEIGEQRAQGLVLLAHVVDHYRAVNLADDVIVVQETAVGMESTATFEGDRVHAPPLVGQLHAFAFPEGTAATGSSHRLRAAGGNTGLGCCCGFVDGSFAAHDFPRSCKTVVPPRQCP